MVEWGGGGDWPNYRMSRGRVMEQFAFCLHVSMPGLFNGGRLVL